MKADPTDYLVTNADAGTNWNVGARITRVSDWQGTDNPAALFTDTKNPGACIWASRSEVLTLDEVTDRLRFLNDWCDDGSRSKELGTSGTHWDGFLTLRAKYRDERDALESAFFAFA